MSMSEITDSGRDEKSGRFQSGNIGGPGRKPGSRNKLGEEFLAKFAADVAEHGASVIERVRAEKPEVYLRVWADLLPRKTELDVNIDIVRETGTVLEAFRAVSALLGSDPAAGARRVRQLASLIDMERDDVVGR